MALPPELGDVPGAANIAPSATDAPDFAAEPSATLMWQVAYPACLIDIFGTCRDCQNLKRNRIPWDRTSH